jgi:transcriptional regulator with XRE-family HTH domain
MVDVKQTDHLKAAFDFEGARRELGIPTQAAFARLLGVSHSWYRRLVSGGLSAAKVNPSTALVSLARAYLHGYRPPEWTAVLALGDAGAVPWRDRRHEREEGIDERETLRVQLAVVDLALRSGLSLREIASALSTLAEYDAKLARQRSKK